MKQNHNSDGLFNLNNPSKSVSNFNGTNQSNLLNGSDTTLCNPCYWTNGWPNGTSVYPLTRTINYFYKVNPTAPEVHILVNGNRQKVHDLNKIYLKNKTEFVIEVFNKWTSPIAMELSLNGKTESKLIIIYPGQRLKLDRFLDKKKRFMFDTYKVNNTDEVKKAIQLNGDISLRFFEEEEQVPVVYDNFVFNSNSGTVNCNYFNSALTNSSNINSSFTSSVNLDSEITKSASRSTRPSKSIETGRVEEGSKSNQEFTQTYKQFKSTSFFSKELKLLPLSTKPMEAKDLIVVCKCGTKQRRGDKHCPECGKRNK